jgi:hypothetical protein
MSIELSDEEQFAKGQDTRDLRVSPDPPEPGIQFIEMIDALGFLYNPTHRWYYFPRMERNEVILLNCYDSKDDGRACFTAHTSFEDPTSPHNAAPRESIEVRALVFWPPETARAALPDVSRSTGPNKERSQ